MTAVPEWQKCPVCDQRAWTADPKDLQFGDCDQCGWPVVYLPSIDGEPTDTVSDFDGAISCLVATRWARRVLRERDEARTQRDEAREDLEAYKLTPDRARLTIAATAAIRAKLAEALREVDRHPINGWGRAGAHGARCAGGVVMTCVRIRPIVAWYDLWIGAYWDRARRRLYVLPVPCIGIVIFFEDEP